jgi:hypothetical protein
LVCRKNGPSATDLHTILTQKNPFPYGFGKLPGSRHASPLTPRAIPDKKVDIWSAECYLGMLVFIVTLVIMNTLTDAI